MISIWDMIVSSGYPFADGTQYFVVGIGLFVFLMLVSLITLPIIVWLVDKFYDRKLKVKLGGGRERKYEIDYYRIIICFLVGIIILMLLNIVMSAHGIFFLSKMFMNEPYLHRKQDFEGSNKNVYLYIIPSSHYVLYFLEAAYEAAEENLILWGFLFLVNFISKLRSKDFYFKTFTFFLIIRVSFVFVCHFNIWELVVNHTDQESSIHNAALEIYPFHTPPKTLRIVEIVCSLVVFSAFAIYTRKLTARRMRRMTADGVTSPLMHRNPNEEAKLTTEIRYVRKYLIGYAVFLVIHLVVNIIECHFISLTVGLIGKDITEVLTSIELGTSIFADVLAFLPLILFLSFITFIAYLAVKNRTGRQGIQESEEPEREEPEREESVTKELKRFRKKRLLLTIPIIVFCTFFTAAFIGYLRFTDGDDMQVTLHPGDYLVISPSGDTPFSKSLISCESYKISGSPTNQLEVFDFLEHYYSKNDTKLSPFILTYKSYKADEKNHTRLHQQIDVPSHPMYMWFPANTCFNTSITVNFTVVLYDYPCYHEIADNNSTLNFGLLILCSDYTKKNESKYYMNCTKKESNASNSCCLHKDAVIHCEDNIPFSLNAVRPYLIGVNQTNDTFLEEGSLIEFNRTIPYMGENSAVNEETFYLTCHHDMRVAGAIAVGILVIMGAYLTAGYFVPFLIWYRCGCSTR